MFIYIYIYDLNRIRDPNSKRSLLIGIGFRERDTAFDFKNALNEYVRYVDRMALADELSATRVSFETPSFPIICVLYHRRINYLSYIYIYKYIPRELYD